MSRNIWPYSAETWKYVVNVDVNDLHLKPSDAMDRSKWTEMIRGNWSAVIVIVMPCMFLVPAHPG